MPAHQPEFSGLVVIPQDTIGLRLRIEKRKNLPETATFKTVNWLEMPSVPFSHQTKGNKTSGSFRIVWNKLGVFVEATVKDKTFIHTEYENLQPLEQRLPAGLFRYDGQCADADRERI